MQTQFQDYEYELKDERNVISFEQKRQSIYDEIMKKRDDTARDVVLVSDTENTPMTRDVVLVSDTENTPMTRELHHVSENTAKERINDLQEEPNVESIKTREVLKDKKIERSKDSSRDEREDQDAICLRPRFARGQEQKREEQTPIVESNASAVEIICDGDSEPTERTFSGITAQQAIGSNLKVFVTLQTTSMADVGGVVKLTAELKRPKRIYELKPCEGDTEEFAADFDQIKTMILSMSLAEREGICLGRLHDCGKRDLWFANMCLLGKYNENDVLETVTIYVDNEEYQIEMNQTMSPVQLKYYKGSGIYGSIVKNKSHPTWQTANVVVFK